MRQSKMTVREFMYNELVKSQQKFNNMYRWENYYSFVDFEEERTFDPVINQPTLADNDKWYDNYEVLHYEKNVREKWERRRKRDCIAGYIVVYHIVVGKIKRG